jgi:uncharacterized repeat protein (TIGR03847 family)
MTPSPSFEFETPDHFTAGTLGPPGQRVFYLQARGGGTLMTLKIEKEQVRALGEYLKRLLGRFPAGAGESIGDLTLLEPADAVWSVGTIGVGYDKERDRVIVEAQEQVEEEEGGEEPAMARFNITRAQAAAFAERADTLIKAGRPICPLCSGPIDPGGHVCPRSNGHVVRNS